MDWNLQGYRRRGRPKRTWRRTIEDEIRNTGRSWNEVKGIAGDRNAWKFFMDALCSIRIKGTDDNDNDVLDGQESIPDRDRSFYFRRSAHTGSESHTMDTGNIVSSDKTVGV